MDLARLNTQIQTAVAIEAKEGHLANYLIDRATERGTSLSEQQRREALELFENYVRSVPELLAAASASAVGTPVEATMQKVMAAAVTYWDEPDDLVPDELGVLGLLDDAYFSLRMLQMVSDRLREESGQALVADDLSALDEVVRDIIGEGLAEVLDDLVILSLSNAPVDELVATIEEHSGSFILASAQTSFTGLSVAALVEERLGFAGRRDASLRADLIGALEQLAGRLEGSASPELVREGTETVAGVLRAGLDEDPSDADSEVPIVAALLVGGLVSQATLGRERDGSFVAGCVDFVLGRLV
ncbi:MAG: YkvA family protein [Enhygromyxa sp.]